MVKGREKRRADPENWVIHSSSRPRKKSRDSGVVDISPASVSAQLLAVTSSSRIRTVSGQSIAARLLDFILTTLRNSSMDASSEELLSVGLFAALPVLLDCNLSQVSLRSAEILGAVALWSYEMNVKAANDKEIVTALVAMIRNQKTDISGAACNTLMDLATTSAGREKLRKAGAIEQLL